jgi:hypothetical protein
MRDYEAVMPECAGLRMVTMAHTIIDANTAQMEDQNRTPVTATANSSRDTDDSVCDDGLGESLQEP